MACARVVQCQPASQLEEKVDGQAPAVLCRDAAALPPLFGLAAAMLLAVDHALFRSALALVGDFLRQRRRGSRAAVQLLDVAFDAVARTDDCLRKPALVRWYQALASELAGAGGSAGAVQAGAPAAQ